MKRIGDGWLYDFNEDLEMFKQTLTEDGIKKSKEIDHMYLQRDCSETALYIQFVSKFGKNPKDFIGDERFNPWVAYSFLKDYCGINETWFEDDVFNERHKNISNVLKGLL